MVTYGDHGQEIELIETATKRLEDAGIKLEKEIKETNHVMKSGTYCNYCDRDSHSFLKTYLNDMYYEICLNFYYLTSLFSVTIIFAYTLGFWSLQASAVGFQTYRNPALGFSIDYPSDWKIWEDGISNENVTFIMPPISESLTLYDAPFIIHIGEVTPYLDTETMTIKNETVERVAQRMMKNLSEHNPVGLEFKPIRQNQSTLAGLPGWKIEAFLGPEANPFYYFFDDFTITNGKIYHLLYGEKPLSPRNIPHCQKDGGLFSDLQSEWHTNRNYQLVNRL